MTTSPHALHYSHETLKRSSSLRPSLELLTSLTGETPLALVLEVEVLRLLPLSLTVIAALALGGCAAPVKLSGYPGPTAMNIDLAQCKSGGFANVEVIGLLPTDGSYEEIGYMTVGQSSTSELVYTSIEKQIEAARVRACQWGADAIVVTNSDGGKGNTWSAWSGLTYRDERESRVVAIRYVEEDASADTEDTTSSAPAPSVAANSPSRNDTVIWYETQGPCEVRIEVHGAGERLVRTMSETRTEPGRYSLVWDWRTTDGVEVRNSDYLYTVFCGSDVLRTGTATVAWASE